MALYVHNNPESSFYTGCVFIQAANLKSLGNGELKDSMLKPDINFRFYEKQHWFLVLVMLLPLTIFDGLTVI